MSTGERIRVWRQYRGMTQEAAAGLVGKSLSWWKKVESGVRRVERLSDLVLIAQILKVRDLADLTGRLEFSLALDRERPHSVVPDIRAAMLSCMAAGPSVGEPLPLDLLRARQVDARRTFHHHRLFVRDTGRYLPELIRDATLAHRRAGDPARRRAAAGLLSEVYLLTCQVVRHVGEPELAWQAIDRCAHYAHDADDPTLVAWAAWQSSGVLKDRGEAEHGLQQCLAAVELVEQGLATPTDEQLSLLGELRLQTALMAAHCSDEGTAMRYLDAGDEVYRRVPGSYRNEVTRYSRDGSWWAAVWVPTALGRSRAAVAAADRVDIAALESRPVESLWYINVARGHAARRDDVATLHILQQAEEASPETVAHSTNVREMCREMMVRDRKSISRDLHSLATRVGIFT